MADVSVLDSSALIDMKRYIPAGDQWAAFRHLEELIDSAQLTLCRQVINELAAVNHPDVPGAWAQGVRRSVRYPLDPDIAVVAEVMQRAGDVVDSEKADEDADPYVLAIALQLARAGTDVEIVTNDCVDRMPIRIAMTTAAGILGMPCVNLETFLDACGIPCRPPKLKTS